MFNFSLCTTNNDWVYLIIIRQSYKTIRFLRFASRNRWQFADLLAVQMVNRLTKSKEDQEDQKRE